MLPFVSSFMALLLFKIASKPGPLLAEPWNLIHISRSAATCVPSVQFTTVAKAKKKKKRQHFPFRAETRGFYHPIPLLPRGLLLSCGCWTNVFSCLVSGTLYKILQIIFPLYCITLEMARQCDLLLVDAATCCEGRKAKYIKSEKQTNKNIGRELIFFPFPAEIEPNDQVKMNPFETRSAAYTHQPPHRWGNIQPSYQSTCSKLKKNRKKNEKKRKEKTQA